jgi:hypothetical protein
MEKLVVHNIMGFNKIYLPEVDELKQLHERVGTEQFISTFSKYDAIIGSIESSEYLKQVKNTKNQK